MRTVQFPPVDTADQDGLLMVGGNLDVDTLISAYQQGIFPWPLYDDLLTWFAPPKRAVLFIKDHHIPRRLKRQIRRSEHHFAVNLNFSEVIEMCASSKNRKGQFGTWITRDLVRAYNALHQAGYAHSFECYRDTKLVGGVYGVWLGRMFAGESMFYREPNASKLAFCFMLEKLQEKGVGWMDCQVMTPLLRSFGAKEILRSDFGKMLEWAIKPVGSAEETSA